MTEKKEITIKKSRINKLLKDILFAFLIVISILLYAQHSGRVVKMKPRGNTSLGSYGFVSPLSNNSRYYPVHGKFFNDTPSYTQKLIIFYFPSIFVEGYTWLSTMTLVVFLIFRLKRLLLKKYKIKIE